jgi:hypothetical protein
VVVKKVTLWIVIALAVTAVPAHARLQGTFPKQRIGTSILETSGGGIVAGDRYVARAAVIAWNRRWSTLTLYLLSRPKVTCATLRTAVAKPGHVVQVYVTNKPLVHVGKPMPGAQVAFVTVFQKANTPEHVAGLKQGAQLMFTSVDSYPGGVWHGVFKVPTRTYGDGKVYGYDGTFAARWCDLRR